jgi:hypothetical protein
VISLFQPKQSWCAQWQRYQFNSVGMYAMWNEGHVTEDIIKHLEKAQRLLPEWVERAKNARPEQEDD